MSATKYTHIAYTEEDVKNIPEDILDELKDEDKVYEYIHGQAILDLPDDINLDMYK
jgi:hypothetical protein